MLYKDQKREKINLKAKPGIVEIAKVAKEHFFPYCANASIDDVFELLITKGIVNIITEGGLELLPEDIKAPYLEKIKAAQLQPQQVEAPQQFELAQNIPTNELLGT